MKTVRYNTNLAAEFWVLSALYRIGVDAHLTLGNKKAVDIVIIRESDIAFTIDVKGVVGPYDWPADNIKVLDKPGHIYALVCFENKISDPSTNPSVWIIPSIKLKDYLIKYKTRIVISRALVKKNATVFQNAWHVLTKNISYNIEK